MATTDDQGERFRVVDEEGRPLGIATRAEVHADPTLIHRSVHVVVETSAGTLFQRRGFAKDTGPGAWDTACAGHVDLDEDFLDAARRELGEELGLEGVEPEPLGRTLLRGQRETELCGVFRLRHDGPFRVALPEVAGLAVYPPGELPDPLTPAAEHVLAWLAAHRAAAVPPE